jgi:hypothetical protein
MAEREYPRWIHHPKYTEPSQIVLNAIEERAALAKWGEPFPDEPEPTVEPYRVYTKEYIRGDGAHQAVTVPTTPPRPDPTEKLRREAEALGIKPDGRWSARRLQEAINSKIAELKEAATALRQSPDDAPVSELSFTTNQDVQ